MDHRVLRPAPRRLLSLVFLLVLVLGVAACGTGTATVESAGGDTTAPTGSVIGETTTTSAVTTTSSTATSGSTGATRTVEVDRLELFASPSGNIACAIDPANGASCWIAEHDWVVESATDPDCELDFGDAVDVTADGVVWPCYGDFSWGPVDRTLAYGDSITAGPFRCESAETGMTCLNGDGRGFTVARAAVETF